ncbi:MAG: hypothetical protein HOE28_04305, partial [Candidatus Magasanikbacteria bacterium]|nr:hypothetical protein [Candidatus Magasanikbacteria bacterium]
MNKKLFLASAMMALAILGGCAKTDISAEDCEDNLCQKAINDAGNDTPTPDIPDIDTEDEPEPDIPDIDTEDEREPDIPDTECTVDNDCELNGTIPSCQEGICTYECSSGFYDLNDDLSLAEEGNGCEYACAISNDGNEACDEVDNDCDGNTDEDFDLIEDLEHCGTCGNACAFDNAVPLCNEGRCVFEECNPGYLNENEDQEDGCEILEDAPECEILQDCPVVRNAIPDCTNDECVYRCEQNFHDINNDLGLAQNSNGCEYACTISNDGVEACDQTDNDCDGEADEDFDLTEDINNCGTCGETCEFDNAVPLCSDGECGFEECLPGYLDENEDPDDGCEALENPPDCEVDNDCPTIPGTVPSCEEELCSYRCADGFYDINEDLGLTENGNGCEYACTISNDGVEICDEADNDCDGDIDETFNLQIDENNCGTCDNVCTFDHATPLCSDGECGFEECLPGYLDENEDPDDGCEALENPPDCEVD